MSVGSDFKAFVMRGNVVDLAVGVIIGAAFGKIVSSLVDDVLMPPIGKLVKGVDFSNLFFALDGNTYTTMKAAKDANVATVNYGLFLNTVINFLIVAFCVFIIIQVLHKWINKPAPPAAPTTKDCPQCAMSIPIAARKCGHCTTQLA
ncbi:MAG TPA: large conductance mechanosensitive channel protein MscL [Candidatus Acidoferrum sp.]|nr:large conductance mechanosensitive channel protein MscL [Candidatus Acidoferrum sp.]